MRAEPQVIEGRQALIVESSTSLPRSLSDLLRDMARFGFTVREDFTLAGARTSCEALRVHRFQTFREGRWLNPRAFSVVIGQRLEAGQPQLQTATVATGLRELRLEMCLDCGAVCVRDITPHGSMGARPARLVDTRTGRTRIAPAVGRRDMVIGWYSGARRNGREYR